MSTFPFPQEYSRHAVVEQSPVRSSALTISRESYPARTSAIESQLRRELASAAYRPIRELEVSYHEGVVTLHGEVPTRHQKQIAQAIVLRVAQVETILNRIVVPACTSSSPTSLRRNRMQPIQPTSRSAPLPPSARETCDNRRCGRRNVATLTTEPDCQIEPAQSLSGSVSSYELYWEFAESDFSSLRKAARAKTVLFHA